MIPVLYTTYNRLEYTKKTLPALLENTPEGDIIVIDNGSTDGTVDYLRSYDDDAFQLILKGSNTGISGAMNTFFEMTTGAEYVAKVDNDTMVHRDWLSNLMTVFDFVPIEILQAAHYFISTVYRDWEDLINKRPCRAFNGSTLVYTKTVGGSGILFKRNIITEPLIQRDLYGWSDFQLSNPQFRRAMFDGVWVDLLDMQGFNQYADDIDREYLVGTGRLLRK